MVFVQWRFMKTTEITKTTKTTQTATKKDSSAGFAEISECRKLRESVV